MSWIKDKLSILQRMSALGIRPEDVRESFVRSSGKGGQNVNKVESCVCLSHLPTGITVRSESERSQEMNRSKAWVLLLDKIERARAQDKEAWVSALEKERRRKRPRPRGLKVKIRELKEKRSVRKSARRKFHARLASDE